MATNKPRITITLTKRQHEVITAISDASGQSMSSILGEIVEVTMPTFERMAATLQKIKSVRQLEQSRLADAMENAQAALEPIAMAAVGQFDLFLANVESAAGMAATPARAGGAGLPESTSAPATNRGATPSGEKAGKPRRTSNSSGSRSKTFSKKVA